MCFASLQATELSGGRLAERLSRVSDSDETVQHTAFNNLPFQPETIDGGVLQNGYRISISGRKKTYNTYTFSL